jgi:hypothetical protein
MAEAAKEGADLRRIEEQISEAVEQLRTDNSLWNLAKKEVRNLSLSFVGESSAAWRPGPRWEGHYSRAGFKLCRQQPIFETSFETKNASKDALHPKSFQEYMIGSVTDQLPDSTHQRSFAPKTGEIATRPSTS